MVSVTSAVPRATLFKRHELRLHVGGKRGIGRSAHVDGIQDAVGLERNPVLPGFDVRARFAQLLQHRVEDVRPRSGEPYAAAGGRGCHQKGAGLDAVGHHAVLRAVQPLDALDRDDVGARAPHARAHGVQAAGEIHHLRLARRILDHRRALRPASPPS